MYLPYALQYNIGERNDNGRSLTSWAALRSELGQRDIWAIQDGPRNYSHDMCIMMFPKAMKLRLTKNRWKSKFEIPLERVETHEQIGGTIGGSDIFKILK